MGFISSFLGIPSSNHSELRSDSNDQLKARIKEVITETEKLQARVPQSVKLKDQEVYDVQSRRNQLRRDLKDLEKERELVIAERIEVQTRLNKIMKGRSEDNNTSNTDDKRNEIQRKFLALYENEWKTAFAYLKTIKSESHGTSILLNALRDVYKECKALANDGFFQQVERCIESPFESTDESNKPGVMPDLLKQQIIEFRKLRAMNGIKNIQKVLVPVIRIMNADSKVIQEYVSRCVEVCWIMVVHDPPLVFEFSSDHIFDKNMFNIYAQPGMYVDYIFWPALLIHHGGAMLVKGIAKGSQVKKPYSHV